MMHLAAPTEAEEESDGSERPRSREAADERRMRDPKMGHMREQTEEEYYRNNPTAEPLTPD